MSVERFIRAYAYVAAAEVVVALLSLTTLLVPFEPFRVYDYKAIPPVLCPSQPMTLQLETEVVDSPLYTIKPFQVTVFWRNAATGVSYGEQRYWVTGRELDRAYRLVGEVKQAPPYPGHYQVGVSAYVRGRVLGILPTQPQEVYELSSSTTRVTRDVCPPGRRGSDDDT